MVDDGRQRTSLLPSAGRASLEVVTQGLLSVLQAPTQLGVLRVPRRDRPGQLLVGLRGQRQLVGQATGLLSRLKHPPGS